MDLRDGDVLGGDPGVVVRGLGRAPRCRRLRDRLAVLERRPVGALSRPRDRDRRGQVVRLGGRLRDQHECARAVRHRTGVEQPERGGDGRRVQRLRDGHLALVLGVLVVERVGVVLRRDVCQIRPVAAEPVEVPPSHQRVRAGERHPRTHLEQLVGGDGQRLRHSFRREVGHPFHPAGDGHVHLAGPHGPDRLANGDTGTGTRLLVACRRTVEPRRLRHQRRLVALSLGECAHEVAVVELFDRLAAHAGVAQRRLCRLGEQIPSRPAGVFAELCEPDPGDAYTRHYRGYGEESV